MKRKYLLSTAITLLFGNHIIQAAATQDFTGTVATLESSERVKFQNLEQYERNRIELQERGVRLHDEKCAAFDSSLGLTSLSPNYEIEQLTLISNIINHYKAVRDDTSVDLALKAKWAHSDLRNISKSVGLLADLPLKLVAPLNSPYSNPHLQHASFFRDLRYLQKLYADGVPKKLTEEEEAQKIMENSSDSLLEVCAAEIAYAKKECDEASITATRNKFSYHTQMFPVLYSIVAAKRDFELLSKAISSIERVKKLDFDTTNEDKKLVNRAALLGTLIIIGEGYTKKNLSSQSSSAAPESALQNLRKLRNKLAHVEWDATSNNLGLYFNNCTGDELVKDLDKILRLLISAKDEISVLTVDQILQKYSTAASGLAATPSTAPAALQLAEIDKLLGALPQKSLDKTAYTLEQKKANLKNEIEVLKKILSINGKEALNDPFPEDLLHTNLTPYLSSKLETELPSAKMDLVIIKTYHDRARSDPIFSFLRTDEQSLRNVELGQADVEANNRVINAIKIYARRCQLKTSLIAHHERLDAALYQFGKIAGLIKQIPENLLYDATSTPSQELRAFRNYIEHGDDLVDATGIAQADFLIRYTSILFSEIEQKLN